MIILIEVVCRIHRPHEPDAIVPSGRQIDRLPGNIIAMPAACAKDSGCIQL